MHCEAKTVKKHFVSLQELLCIFPLRMQQQVNDDACRNHAPATIKLPGDDKNSFQLKNFEARWFAPFTIYFEFESFLMPFSSGTAYSGAPLAVVIEKHITSGFALTWLIAVFRHQKNLLSTAPKIMKNFIRKTR